MQNRIFSNAIWNVVNGSSSAVVAVAVPPFLTRLLSPEAYGAWALALQIGTYMGLFGFGLQMAVGRYVAYAEARNDIAQRDGIVSTAFWFLAAASVIGWMTICGVGLSIERLLPNLSPDLAGQTRGAVILVGLALAINLPASIFAAVFTGQHRSDVPAKIQGSGRILLALGLIVAGFSRSLTVLGLVYAFISILTALALWLAWRTRTPGPNLAMRNASGAHGRELVGFCLSLTVWNFAMLLVSGLDLLIVGRWDYAATPYYAVSVTLVTLLSGTLTSLSSALVPASASVTGQDDDAVQRLLFRATRLIVAASLVAAIPLVFGSRLILGLWLGDSYAVVAAPLLVILALATVLRNAMVPYVTIAIGTGHQRKMIWTPVLEGLSSVIAGLLLVRIAGAHGVAMAKIVGGAIGVSLLLAQHPLKTVLGTISRVSIFYHCIVRPFVAAVPPIAAYLALDQIIPDQPALALALILSVGLASVYALSLTAQDRDFALQFVINRITGRRALNSAG